jgi:hypothetical protein
MTHIEAITKSGFFKLNKLKTTTKQQTTQVRMLNHGYKTENSCAA